MAQGKRLRVAVVGAGGIADSHRAAYQAHHHDVDLVAAADVDETRAVAFCAGTEHAKPYRDIGTLLAEQEPDLVSICTPPGLHVEQTKMALESGAWVWCEAAVSVAGRVRRDELPPNGTGAPTFPSSTSSGPAPPPRTSGTCSRRGRLGRPLVAHCQTTWYRDDAYYAVPWRGRWETEGGGPAMGHGIHQMDLLLHLLGDWAEVRAMTARLVHDVETEDVSTALVRFESGVLATVVNSVVSPDEVSRIRIDCERATAELTHLYGYGNGDWRYTAAPGLGGVDAPARGCPELACRRVGARSCRVSATVGGRLAAGPDGRRVLEFVAALYKSATIGLGVRRGEIGPGDAVLPVHGGATEGTVSAPITVTHRHGDHVTVEAAGVQLMSYVYKPDPVAYESRKPYTHPLRTLRGRRVSGYRPADHRWHKGLQMTASHLSGQNFWGGHTYVPGRWYQDLPDRIGSMRHDEFAAFIVDGDRLSITERLTWVTNGGDPWARERRDIVVHSVEPDEGAWAIDWAIELTNVRDAPLVFGSPTTAGREQAGYTGLHWRGPRDFSGGRVLGPGGPGWRQDDGRAGAVARLRR